MEHAYTRFGLLRHAKTIWNQEHRIQGSGDSPLTDEGKETSRLWGAFLKTMTPLWQKIVVSPLPRAQTTAAIINEFLELPVEIDEELREMNWGEWEGMSLPELKSQAPAELARQIEAGWEFRAPSGESRTELLTRVRAALLRHQSGASEHILIITHLGVINALLRHIEGRDYLPSEPKIAWKNRMHIISANQGSLAIEQLNIEPL
jgi:broad specificity phosphatase PhoE